MSLVTTAVCRVRQALLRARRRPAVRPTAEEGTGAVFSVAAILRANRLRKPLLVIGSGADAWTGRVTHALEENDLTFALADTLPDRPTIEDAEALRLRWVTESCDCFVVLGDGAAIDAVKAAAARAVSRGRSILNMVGVDKVRRKLPPMVAIPTVAGAGAETLSWATLTDERGGLFVLDDPALTPSFAVLDPELLETMSRPALADAAADGICLAAEAWLSGYGDEFARAAAADALRGFFEAVEPCWNSGGSALQRSVLLSASRSAGEAGSRAGCGYVRALCRAMARVRGGAPSEYAAVLLPSILEKYGNHAADRLARLAELIEVAPAEGTKAEKAAALIGRIRQLTFRIGLPDVFEAVPEDSLSEIADLAAAEANPRYACPVVWSAAELTAVLRDVCAVR